MSNVRLNRILREFDDVRGELLHEIEVMDPDEFDWVPRPGMKSIRAQLDEIGRMEKVVLEHVRTGNRPKWEVALVWPGDDLQSYLGVLENLRTDLKQYLSTFQDEDMDEPIPLPETWVQFWKSTDLAREEYLRWLIRHEYYHLGQIVAFLWILGKNPYDKSVEENPYDQTEEGT